MKGWRVGRGREPLAVLMRHPGLRRPLIYEPRGARYLLGLTVQHCSETFECWTGEALDCWVCEERLLDLTGVDGRRALILSLLNEPDVLLAEVRASELLEGVDEFHRAFRAWADRSDGYYPLDRLLKEWNRHE